ncbi:MAG: glycosyltransferase family 4 protein [Candidatus Nezhaarchaeales archaeon]
MLSWEYPPRIVGGLARHVYWLSRSLAKRGVEVAVVTLDHPEAPEREFEEGLEVVRVMSHGLASPDFASWVHQFNFKMVKAALEEVGDCSIIHAHDWLTAVAGVTLKHLLRRPLIATIHSTEFGRRGGSLRDPLQRHIHEVEWWLTYESWRVVVCSNYMKMELTASLGVPEDKIDVIPNGVGATKPLWPERLREVRRRYAEDWESIVLFVGRMVYEKGPHVLVDAALELLSRRWDVKFVLVGEGPLRKELMDKVQSSGLAHKFYFTSFIDDLELSELYAACDVAVFPSLYEPFGIVALEAMAAGKPVVVSDVGGLSELVVDGLNGIKVPSGRAHELSLAIERLLESKEEARRMGERALRRVREAYSWDRIAERTEGVYRRVLREYFRGPWRPRVAG